MNRTVVLWSPPGKTPTRPVRSLAASLRTGDLTAASALVAWQQDCPALRAAYVHGDRHDLWWEFPLAASFRWQAHIARMSTEAYRLRLAELAGALDLQPLLSRSVEELTPGERARADLAVALLARPRVLIWEEPFANLQGADRTLATQLVRILCATEDLQALLINAEPLAKEDACHDGTDEAGADHARGLAANRSSGRWAAAGGSRWA